MNVLKMKSSIISLMEIWKASKDLEDQGYLFDMVVNHDEDRRVKLIFKTLIDKSFEKTQYEDDATTMNSRLFLL